MARMTFAKQKDTGKIVGIDEVEKGLACNCICPHCGDILEAKKGKVNVHHFAHCNINDSSFCSESALHLAAKQVLQEEREIMLPSLKIGKNNFEVLPDKYLFKYDSVDIEESVPVDEGVIRPDAILHNDKANLAIEILVSHAVDDVKAQKIKQAKLTTIEISINADDILNKEMLRNFLIIKTTNKKWIFSNQKDYFEKNIPKLCKKIKVIDSHIKSCPLNVWQGKYLVTEINKCRGCKYGFEVNSEYVLCLGNKRISNAEDIKLYMENSEEHINNHIAKELEEDKKTFLSELCPVCHSFLRVGNAVDPYISCKNFKVCKFTANIDLIKYTSCFKDRYGNNTVVDLPKFVLDDVLKLQKGAKEEVEKIDRLFTLGFCPYCSERLVIRDGKRGKFLGCKGYSNFDYSCQFTASLDFENMTATFQTRYNPKRTIVKPIPENVIKEYDTRKKFPQRNFFLSEKNRRDS